MSRRDELAALRRRRRASTVRPRFVVVRGPDALVVPAEPGVGQDLDAVGRRRRARSLLLTPQGKLDVDFRLVRVGDEAWLDCEAGFGAQLAASLDRFRIRVKAEIDDRTGELRACVGADVGRAPRVDAVPTRLPRTSRVVRPRGAADDRRSGRDASTLHADARRRSTRSRRSRRARIEQGIPRAAGSTSTRRRSRRRRSSSGTRSRSRRGASSARSSSAASTRRGHVNRYLRRVPRSRATGPPRRRGRGRRQGRRRGDERAAAAARARRRSRSATSGARSSRRPTVDRRWRAGVGAAPRGASAERRCSR